MMPQKRSVARRRGETGQSLVEATLMAPWIFILFLAIVDAGMYGYAMVATENAARVAGLYAAETFEPGSDSAPKTPTQKDIDLACDNARNELRMMPNYGLLPQDCSNAPLTVNISRVPSASSADGEPGVQLLVSYQTVQLFPIPGMQGRLTINREVQMRPEH